MTAIDVVEQFPELRTRKIDTKKCMNRLQFIEAFRMVDVKVEGISRVLKHALWVAKSAVAADSLVIYRMAKAQASDGRNPSLASHVAAMKRDFGRRGMTKAQRDERRRLQFEAAVEQAVAERMAQLRAA